LGDPRKPRRQYSTPRNPWQSDQLAQELYLLGTFGLRNKRELWRAQTELSRLRKQARELLAAPAAVRADREAKLLAYVRRLGMVSATAPLDDVLSLTAENLLERRLQTVVWRRGLARSPHHARQLIVHRHVQVGERTVRVPGYLVRTTEESLVRVRPDSPLAQTVAPAAPAPSST
jgi:small subunit ribosomal protein S4